MKITTFFIAGGAALAALSSVSASAADAQKDSFYGSTAIASGDYASAEHVLKVVSYSSEKDPGRLINLATVYIQTQRFDKARAALQQVQRLPDEVLVLSGGASFTSRNIAHAMLSRLP